jgi:hypothetical protein
MSVMLREAENAADLRQAAVEAVLAARWECAELAARKSAEAVGELLLGHAAELACSALGRDQILSRALESAAADVRAGRPALEDGAAFFFREAVPDGARSVVREQVFRHSGVPSRASQAVAAELERRLRSEGLGDRELSERLLAEAHLHERLWDDPRLGADTHTRLILLCAVPKVIERSEALDPSRARFLRRRETPRSRRRRALVLARPGPATIAPAWTIRRRARWPMAECLWAAGVAAAAAAAWLLIDI